MSLYQFGKRRPPPWHKKSWTTGSTILPHSDREQEFINKLSQEHFSLWKIKHTRTTTAQPQCNGPVENFNHTSSWALSLVTIRLNGKSSFTQGTLLTIHPINQLLPQLPSSCCVDFLSIPLAFMQRLIQIPAPFLQPRSMSTTPATRAQESHEAQQNSECPTKRAFDQHTDILTFSMDQQVLVPAFL